MDMTSTSDDSLTEHRTARGDRAVLRSVQTWPQGPRALFVNAIKRESPSLLEQLLRENAVQADGAYICHAWDRFLKGRADVNAVKIASGEKSPSKYPFFCGPLLNGEAAPKDRLAFGRYQIFTIEYDVDNDLEFFMEQVGWNLPVKKPNESCMGKLFSTLKGRFADFHLLSVVWSGNKSLHIHVVFDTTLFCDRHGVPHVETLHAGYNAHWLILAQIVHSTLKPSRFIQPDDSLSWQTAYRRTPDAIRKIEKPHHPLGLHQGSRVRQLVLWEQASLRKKEGVNELFFSPTRYPAAVNSTVARASRATKIAHRRYRLSISQFQHVERHLASHYGSEGGGLRFSHLSQEGEIYKAKFFNGPFDQNASSYMHEDFATPRLIGATAQDIDPASVPALPLPLGQMITVWCSELDQTAEFNPAALESAYQRMQRDLPCRLLLGTQFVLVHAPEGIRKSSTVMSLIGLSTIRGKQGRPSMFTCSSYANARSKAREFNFPNRAQPGAERDDGFVGIYWPSFSELYRATADKLNLNQLTQADAETAGLKNLWALIQRDQPSVVDAMRDWHEDVVGKIRGRNPVLFTVHEVGFRWRDNSMTRQIFAPNFFAPDFDRWQAHANSRLNWMIIDEIGYPMFVDLLSPKQMQWLEMLRDHSPRVWSGRSSERQREHFEQHADAMGGEAGLDLFKAQRALRVGLDTFQAVNVHDNQEYPPRGDAEKVDCQGNPTPKPYACEGETYYVCPRDWWKDGDHRVANTVILTTTETVPVAVVQKVLEAVDNECDEGHEEGAPKLAHYAPNFRLGRDAIDVFASGKVVATRIGKLTDGYRGRRDLHIISNKLAEVENATSHFDARGANDLSEKDIVQIVTMFPAGQYKELRALGTWLGRDDLVRLAHVDQINQSCGRNRGPRNRGKSHLMMISLRLFRILNACPSAMRELRYAFRTSVDANQKSNAR